MTVFRNNIRWSSSGGLHSRPRTHGADNKMSESRSRTQATRRKSVISTSSRSQSRKGKKDKEVYKTILKNYKLSTYLEHFLGYFLVDFIPMPF